MDLNRIHYFFKAVEYKNFTQASNACHIGQTTMSKCSTNEYFTYRHENNRSKLYQLCNNIYYITFNKVEYVK